MPAIDVDATMAPMNYEVMTDNEPILERKTKKQKKSGTDFYMTHSCNKSWSHA